MNCKSGELLPYTAPIYWELGTRTELLLPPPGIII
jgi:hypothetical protein